MNSSDLFFALLIAGPATLTLPSGLQFGRVVLRRGDPELRRLVAMALLVDAISIALLARFVADECDMGPIHGWDFLSPVVAASAGLAWRSIWILHATRCAARGALGPRMLGWAWVLAELCWMVPSVYLLAEWADCLDFVVVEW